MLWFRAPTVRQILVGRWNQARREGGACKPKYVMSDAYKMFVKIAWEEEVMEKYRRRWQDNIGMDLKKHSVNRICLFQKWSQWRAASVTVTHIPIRKEARNFLTSWAALSVLKREILHVENVMKYLAQKEVRSICEKKMPFYTTQLSKYWADRRIIYNFQPSFSIKFTFIHYCKFGSNSTAVKIVKDNAPHHRGVHITFRHFSI